MINNNQDKCQRVIISKATKNDSKDVWQWRNDELTKKMFKISDNVNWEAHSYWYEKSLVNPNRYLYLGFLNDDEKIGICRFDVDINANIAEVSINLNPQYRNKKLSSQLLSESISKFSEEKNIDLVATIKKSNIESIKCFTKSGFTFEREDEVYGYYKKQASKLSA